MKRLLPVFIIFFSFTAAAQSPHLSVILKMDSTKTESVRYKIEMKFCDPKQTTTRGDLFTKDTSKINFATLGTDDVNCNPYFSKGEADPLTGEAENIANGFRFSNQVFAWEKIIVFKISNQSTKGRTPPMYIVIPVKDKSFVTNIELTDLVFQSNKVMFPAQMKSTRSTNSLTVNHSLKNEKTIEVDDFLLKDLL